METFGKYQLLRRIGAGGMAEVFLAKEPLAGGLAKILVIKKIHPQLAETPQFRQMFEDEAKIGVNLNHPNIVQTFSYGQIGPTFFLAMEYVEGVDLLRLLNTALEAGQRIPFGLTAYLGQQVAKGLDYAHRRVDEYGEAVGIVHRDISPQNILVSWDGMVKLVDFGIARARHVKESVGVVKGKFAYMSPEQASGKPVDARSDLFSMGIVLWELAASQSLFGNLNGKHALAAIRTGNFRRPEEVDASVPPGLSEIIMRALTVRMDDRYQTARDMHRALGKFFFELSAKEGQIFESGAMASFMARVVPRERAPASAEPARLSLSVPVGTQRPRAATNPAVLSTARPIVVIEGELAGMSSLRRSVGDSRAREVLLDFLRVTEHVAYKHGAHPERIDERGFAYVVGLAGGKGRAAQDGQDGVVGPRAEVAVEEALRGFNDVPVGVRQVGDLGVAVEVEEDKILLLLAVNAGGERRRPEQPGGEDPAVRVDGKGEGGAAGVANAVGDEGRGVEGGVDVTWIERTDQRGHRGADGNAVVAAVRVGGDRPDRPGEKRAVKRGAVPRDDELGLGRGNFAEVRGRRLDGVLPRLQGDGERGEVGLRGDETGVAHPGEVESLVQGAGQRVLRAGGRGAGEGQQAEGGGNRGEGGSDVKAARGQTAGHRQGATLRGPSPRAKGKMSGLMGCFGVGAQTVRRRSGRKRRQPGLDRMTG